MNKAEKRKLKMSLYKHGNMILYIAIFAMASAITIFAAIGRDNGTEFIDESRIAYTEETIAVTNKNTQKVAANSTEGFTEELTTQVATTEEQTTEPEVSTADTSRVKIAVETLNVRAEASQEAQILGMADEGDTFEVISRNGEWIEIDFNGNNGFIKAEFTAAVE